MTFVAFRLPALLARAWQMNMWQSAKTTISQPLTAASYPPIRINDQARTALPACWETTFYLTSS